MAQGRDRVDVLVVIDSLGQGGAEQSLLATAPHLAEHGIDVTVALLRSVAPERERALAAAGVPVRVIGPASGLPAVAWAVRRELRSSRPDVLHVTLFEPIVGGALAALGTGVPVLASQVNTPPSTDGSAPADAAGSRRKLAVAVALEAFVCRRLVRRVHAVTPGVRDAMVDRYRLDPARVTVAERGRDGQRFHPPAPGERAAARAELGVPADAPVLAALGRHDPQKGFLDLVRAVALLTPDHPDLVVLLAGRDGPATAELRHAIAAADLGGRIRLLGDRADPERVLAAADCFVLSSHREGTSGATIEAMATGLPVVATALAGLRGIVVDGDQARTVPAADPAALAAGIAEVLADPDLAARLGRAGRRTFEDRFTIDASVAALADLYRSVAGRRPPAAPGSDPRPAHVGPASAPPGAPGTFTVVIATRDRRSAVLAQVERLRGLVGAPDEVVVVDDGSSDGTAAALADVGDPPVVIRTEGEGPATARNRGAAVATGRWLVFLDDDDEPDDDWMTAFRDLAEGRPDARHLTVGRRLRTGDVVTTTPVPTLGAAFGSARASFLAGTFAVRRDAFDQVGGFLPGLRTMEFTDLAMRLFEQVGADERAVLDEPRITIVQRPRDARASQVPETYVAGVRAVLAHCEGQLRRDPSFYADTLASLGVAEVRLGEVRRGRRHLVGAVRARPWSPWQLGRVVVSLVPVLRRRIWGAPA